MVGEPAAGGRRSRRDGGHAGRPGAVHRLASRRGGWPGRSWGRPASRRGQRRDPARLGANADGQLGDGTTTDAGTPVKVRLPAGTRAASVRVGCDHTLALTSTGQVLAWGTNGDGQLGNGTTTSSGSPVRVKLPAGRAVPFAIAAGPESDISLALVPAA